MKHCNSASGREKKAAKHSDGCHLSNCVYFSLWKSNYWTGQTAMGLLFQEEVLACDDCYAQLGLCCRFGGNFRDALKTAGKAGIFRNSLQGFVRELGATVCMCLCRYILSWLCVFGGVRVAVRACAFMNRQL